MNVKIKASGVVCLIGDDYSRVYAALKKNLGAPLGDFFTERVPGHEYLQWELPGDDWTSLDKADPLIAREVREEVLRRQQEVCNRFAANQDMAQRVLSVPDDSFVFFRQDGQGGLDIRLTVWGYRYPERIKGAEIKGIATPKVVTERVKILCIKDGSPVPEQEIRLNDFVRRTGADGMYDLGDMPLGYQFDVEAGPQKIRAIVLPGQGIITLDLSEPEPEPEPEPVVPEPVAEPEPEPIPEPEPVPEPEPEPEPEPAPEPEEDVVSRKEKPSWLLWLLLLLMTAGTFALCYGIIYVW